MQDDEKAHAKIVATFYAFFSYDKLTEHPGVSMSIPIWDARRGRDTLFDYIQRAMQNTIKVKAYIIKLLVKA